MNTIQTRKITLVGMMLVSIMLGGCGLMQSGQFKNYQSAAAEYNREAEAHYEAGRYPEAVAAYTSAIASTNAAKSACSDVGGMLNCTWDWKNYRNNMRIIYTRRGWARFRAGDRQGAIADIQHAVNTYPKENYPQSWYLLGLLQLDAGNRAEALRTHAELKKQNAELAQKLAEQLQRFK